MTASSPCPNQHRLRGLLDGSLPPSEQTQVNSHLDTCTDCQHTLEGLVADSGCWAGAARHLAGETPVPEAALHRVMRELKGPPEGDATQVVPATASTGDLDFLAPSTHPGALGRLGSYEVLEQLGRGGMGVVLRAFDPALHRQVAIKVLAPHLAREQVNRQRFIREARAAAAVNHEHVVHVYAVDESGPLPFLVMEYVRGVTLQQWLDRHGPLEPAEVVRIGWQAAQGLAAAHAQGLVHRDIKPGNILLEGEQRRVKLTDFGLARAADDVRLTQSGSIAGTPQYMAPEQARGDPVDHRADLFSLGTVLYALCTGTPPFQGETTMSVLYKITHDDPRPVREVNPKVPEWLADVIDRLHAKKPEERFQSAAELADLLAGYLAHLQQSGSVPPPPPRPRSTAAPAARPRRGWQFVAAVVLALGLTEAVGFTDLAGTILRIVTDQGTLVVQVDDPNLAVTVDGKDLVFTGPGLHEVRVSAGSHRVQASREGKEVYQEIVTLTRNGKTLVRVSTEPSRPAEPVFSTTNLVLNGDFSEPADVDGKEAAYWIALARTTPTEPEAQCYRDTTVRYQDAATLAIVKPQAVSPLPEAGFMQNILRLPAGEKVHLSGYLRTRDLQGSATIRLQLMDPQGRPQAAFDVQQVSGTTDWTRYATVIDIPQQGAVGTLSLVLRGKGSAWFANVGLYTSRGSRFPAPRSAAAASAEMPATPGKQLLNNGGFDDVADGRPRAWNPMGLGVMGLTFQADEAIKHGGTASATIINTSHGGEPFNWRQDVFAPPSGQVLELTGWVRTKDAMLASVGVQLLDANGQLIAFHTTQNRQDFKGTADWQQFTLRFPVPRGTGTVAILAMLTGRGQAWFDDFQLVVEPKRP